MSPQASQASHAATGFPRVSGDEPDLPAGGDSELVFSPRERG